MAPAGDNKTGTQRHVGHTHKASCPCGDEWPSPRARAAPAGGTLPAPVSPLRRFWGVVVGQESKAGGSVAKQGAMSGERRAEIYTHEAPWPLYAANWSVRASVLSPCHWANRARAGGGAAAKWVASSAEARISAAQRVAGRAQH